MKKTLPGQLRFGKVAYRLLVKIFLWFWLTVWGVVAVVIVVNHMTGLHVVKQPNMYATVMPILATEAIQAYERDGPKGFAQFAQTNVNDEQRVLYMLDGFNHDVLGRPISDSGLRTAHATKSGELLMLRDHIAAYRFTSSSGHPYILLLYISTPLGELREIVQEKGVFFLLSLLMIVTILCLWLAFHISSPIYAIQSAARRVTSGDLTARAPAEVLKRHDELAELARDFNTMVERIEVLVRGHKYLLAAVSHEIRSPLARLTLCVALLRKESQVGTDRLLLRMEKDIEVMDSLMGQLLTLSRFQTGISGDVWQSVDLSELVEEIAANGDFEARADDKSVIAKINDLAVLPSANHYALQSACENIVRNAIRYTGTDTTVEIELSVERSSATTFAIISVHDRGPGVPEEMLDSIFKPFFRVCGETPAAASNGLGLAIAAGAVHLHRGTIFSANRLGGGLDVVVRLPLDSVDRDESVVVL